MDPDAPGYAWASNAQSYEPVIAEVLGRRSLMDAIVYSAPTLNAVIANGKPLHTIVTNAVSYLFTPQVGLAKRNHDIPPQELAAWTSVARTVLNMNETFMRN